MPFTFSHPALVLLLLRKPTKWLSATGLLAGSVVPDFEYFLRMRKGLSYYSHTWTGLLWFDLPFAVLLTVLFHQVVRMPLLAHLPAPLSARFVPFSSLNWPQVLRNRWPVVLLSVLIGVLTHFGWDWFVHRSGDYWYVHQRIISAFHGWESHSHLYNRVHLAHSVAGLLAVGLAIYFLPKSSAALASSRQIGLFWFSIVLLTAAIAGLRFALGTDLYVEDRIVAILAALLLALVFTCAVDQLSQRKSVAR
ncbi:DUF4184 family protein [Hymenobacter sp. BT770]|uniref:DUF4184 family protein n=1 Tax=Hymenobacter sp. BT770 TaxID=2886942 RepID=UPI001D103DBD|nr:DUF4184 family protein [Hymenobacter sp. BT770]MCC3152800.1 DUF4184 family protein [Hymenobacter sp. BT770]MDO3414875.1 DUF4184 family protein [Hymenobacter sp. BT770]